MVFTNAFWFRPATAGARHRPARLASGAVVPIALVLRRAGPVPAQLGCRRWRRSTGRNDRTERDAGDDRAVIGSARPRPDNADIGRTAIRRAHRRTTVRS